MAYVVWKFVRGKGPYAYLRRSERVDGRVLSREVGYLGRWGAGGSGTVRPGDVVLGPEGEELRVPEFSPSILRWLPTTELGELPTTGTGARPASTEGESNGVPTTVSGQLPTTPGPAPEGVGDPLPTTAGPDGGPLPTTAAAGDDALPTAAGYGDGPPLAARPHRLGDGSWGVVSELRLSVGDVVEVRTARGQTWTATVTEILEPTGRGFLARTSGRPGR